MLIIVAEFFSYSRAAWISLFCAFGFYILVRLNIKISYLIIGTLLVSTIVVAKFDSVLDNMRTDGLQKEETVGDHLGSVTNLQNDASNLERVNRWVCAVRMFQEKPLTGFGPGTYQYEYDQFQSVDYMTRISTHGGNRGHAHSEYLGALAENGIFGLINLIVLVFYSIHLALVNLKRYKHDQLKSVIIFGASGGLVTFFVHGLFNGFLDTEKMSILVLGALGILLNYDLEFKRGKS
jgi:O-antigen ligase